MGGILPPAISILSRTLLSVCKTALPDSLAMPRESRVNEKAPQLPESKVSGPGI